MLALHIAKAGKPHNMDDTCLNGSSSSSSKQFTETIAVMYGPKEICLFALRGAFEVSTRRRGI